MVVGPVSLLLLLQLQFLPYHDKSITWWHRAALLVDLGFVWWLWRKVLDGRETEAEPARSGEGFPHPEAPAQPASKDEETLHHAASALVLRGSLRSRLRMRAARLIAGASLSLAALAFSFAVATFPGEWQEWPLSLVARHEPERGRRIGFLDEYTYLADFTL